MEIPDEIGEFSAGFYSARIELELGSRAVEYDLGERFWHRLLRRPEDAHEEQGSHRE